MFSFISTLITTVVKTVDDALEKTPAHQIILGTAALYFLYNQYHNPWIGRAYRSRNNKTLQQNAIDTVYDLLKYLPPVKNYLSKELDKNLESTKEKLKKQRAIMSLLDEIPKKGLSPLQILKQFDIKLEDCTFDFSSIKENDEAKQITVEEGDGKDSGALYAVYPKELVELLKEVYGKTALTNPMHDKWPRINAMQAEIIKFCQNLFHGSTEDAYGLITHGGTTSIIEAMAAYVIKARARGIEHPEIVVPETAHAAFKKAAELTGATLITVPVDKKTGAVTADEMRKYLSGNTAVMVGSAPSFMNGICDPIGDLGKLAKDKNIPLHVDACLGGFLTAFADTSSSPMDFRVPGVTSISADFHKYGYCPKGTSVCLFSKDSPALSVYAALNWQGGLYATPGILDGSTSGARVAEIYTVLCYYGLELYQKITQSIISLRQNLQNKVSKLNSDISEDETLKKNITNDSNDSKKSIKLNIGDIYVYGDPQWSVLGFRSDTLDPHLIADELDQRGWKLNLLQNPKGFHLCLTHVHTLVKDFEVNFIRDLIQAIAAVKLYPKDKKPSGNVKVYGAVGMMPTEVQYQVCEQYQKERLKYSMSVCSQLEDELLNYSENEQKQIIKELLNNPNLEQNQKKDQKYSEIINNLGVFSKSENNSFEEDKNKENNEITKVKIE